MKNLTKTIAGLAMGAALILTPTIGANAASVPVRGYTFTSLSDCDAKEASLAQRGHAITRSCTALYNQNGSWSGLWTMSATVRPVGTP
jgi:hypothetical protein